MCLLSVRGESFSVGLCRAKITEERAKTTEGCAKITEVRAKTTEERTAFCIARFLARYAAFYIARFLARFARYAAFL